MVSGPKLMFLEFRLQTCELATLIWKKLKAARPLWKASQPRCWKKHHSKELGPIFGSVPRRTLQWDFKVELVTLKNESCVSPMMEPNGSCQNRMLLELLWKPLCMGRRRLLCRLAWEGKRKPTPRPPVFKMATRKLSLLHLQVADYSWKGMSWASLVCLQTLDPKPNQSGWQPSFLKRSCRKTSPTNAWMACHSPHRLAAGHPTGQPVGNGQPKVAPTMTFKAMEWRMLARLCQVGVILFKTGSLGLTSQTKRSNTSLAVWLRPMVWSRAATRAP